MTLFYANDVATLPSTIRIIPQIVYFISRLLLCSWSRRIPPKVAMTTFSWVQMKADVFPLAWAEKI